MAIEIERKFLLANDSWRKDADSGTRICQGYMTETGPASVRVRIEGDHANINIKSATLDMTRQEYEYPVPMSDAESMLARICLKPVIDKTRFHVNYHGKLWEIDVFEGDNEGLVVAEIELNSIDEPFDLPSWAGQEVTQEKRYYNVCLVKYPYKDWQS